MLVLDPTGEEALDLATRGHAVTLAPGAGRPLTELKRAAVEALPVQSVRALLGLDAFGRRIWFYHYLRPSLRPETQRWWDAREAFIREGIWQMGARGRAGRRATQRAWRGLVAADGLPDLCRDPEQQRQLAQRLSGARGRLRGALLAHAEADGLQDRVIAILQRGALEAHTDIQWLLAGALWEPSPHPRWLSPEGHAALRAHPDRWRVHAGDLATLPADTFSTLVVVGAWTTGDWAAVAHALRPGATILGPTNRAPAGATPVTAPGRTLHPPRSCWTRP